MSKQKQTESFYDEGQPVVKKKRKHNIFAFVICFLIAFIIWIYASNLEEKKKNEDQTAQASATVVSSDVLSL